MKTIAQRRRDELERFNEEYIGNIDEARHIVNCFYRLAGLSERIAYMNNDEYFYTRRRAYIEAQEEREARAIERLDAMLKPYGLHMVVSIYPTIVKTVNECGGVATVYSGIYYR